MGDAKQVQWRIFALTYVTYAVYYLTRLNFSLALPSIAMELGYTKLTLGVIGGAFSISYAIGQFVNGQLAENIGAKRMILMGLALTAAMNLIFGYTDLFILMVVAWSINGYAQSTGWPSVVKIISRRFRSALGTVGGFFGSCFLVGNMVAWSLLGLIMANYGWRATFLIPPVIVLMVAAVFYLGVEDRPSGGNDARGGRVSFSLQRIALSKTLITVAAAYTLLQFVRSGFTLWAPSYLFETYDLPVDVTGYGVTVIPLGGIVGSVISGWLSDRRRLRRPMVMFILTLTLTLILSIFHEASSYGLDAGILVLFLSGLALYGPHVLMATVVPMEHEESYGAAGVAGFIDGIGYLGLTFADPFIGWIVDNYGWGGAINFWFMSSLSSAFLTGLLCLWTQR